MVKELCILDGTCLDVKVQGLSWSLGYFVVAEGQCFALRQ